ncbi:cell division protein PerM [Streptacidiphilus anmyonensis]|uniref:cell division protein PerM n=1 Tax=Streptacidiphilus anmyonensis TaxID=405782 RepID=UPI0006937DD7|nr:DUF6350 family protein [Streptacidiphilus anmyonensis]
MALFDRTALLAGAGAAFAGWGIVAVPVLLLWVATPYADGDLTAVPRLAAALWLLGHGGPLRWDGTAGHAVLGVAPLLVTALVAGLVHQAAARTGRRRDVVLGYLGVAVPAALLGLGSEPRTEPVPDLLWVGLLALLAAMAGARRSTGEWGLAAAWRSVRARGEWLGVWPVFAPDGALARRLERARTLAPQRDEALRAGLAGAFALLGGGAAVLAVSILVHLGAAGTSAQLLAPDLAGRLSLMLVCVVLVPNAAIWSGAYALGTGFTLGGHAAAFGSQPLAPLALPLLADTPTPGRSVFGIAALVVPSASGAVVGWALTRDVARETEEMGEVGKAEEAGEAGEARGSTEAAEFAASVGRAQVGTRRGWAALALVVLGASACTGLLAGAAAQWAGGTLGDGVLAQVGPPVGWTALAAFGWTFAVALPTAFLLSWIHRRRTTPKTSHRPDTGAPAADASPADTGVRKVSPVSAALAAVIDGVDWGFPDEEPDRGLADTESARTGSAAGPVAVSEVQPEPRPGPGQEPEQEPEPDRGTTPEPDPGTTQEPEPWSSASATQ